ncbi:MAG: methyl-accepting chemotaxis protein [Elusimicrobiales bacterium]|nr:methyl-accepting chemotaxis protein [Elusimicrobiales bacterium]
MKWFNNISTLAKLIVGFGVVLLLSAVVIFTADKSLTDIAGSEKRIEEFSFNKIISLMELRNHWNYNRGQMLELTLAASRADQKAIEKSITERTLLIDELIETLLKLDPDPRSQSQFAEIKSTLAEYRRTQDQQITLIAQGKAEAAREYSLGIQADRYDKIRLLASQLSEREQESLKKTIAMDIQRTKSSVQFFWLTGALAFFFGISMIVFLNKTIAKPLGVVSEAALRISTGNLSDNITVEARSDEIGAVTRAVRQMTEKLRSSITLISEGVSTLGASASEILAATTQVAAGTAENASAISETTSTVAQVQQATQLSSQKAKLVADSAQRLAQVSAAGQKATDETAAGMRLIRDQMEAIARTIVRLSEHSQSIGGIIASVTDIADQSNLLAVNAAIEAARAGEQGKGFAVVAQEIKSLAEQSKQATTQVRNILTEVQKATSAAVMATEQGSKAVEAGVKQSAQAGESIRVLAESSTEAAQTAIQIVASSQQQQLGMDQIKTSMGMINQAGAETASSMQQATTAARNLHELGLKLKGLVEQFKV